MSFPLIVVPPSDRVGISFREISVDETNLSAYTFSSQDLGPADATRHIVIGAAWRRNSISPTLTGITVGGVSCTIADGSKLDGTISGCALGIVAVPTGTTGDVVITLSNTCSGCGISVWALTNLDSATPVGTSEASSTTTDLALPALSTEAQGVALFVAVSEDNNLTFTWVNPTKDFQSVIESGGGTTFSGANMQTDGTNVSENVQSTGSSVKYAVAASWR
ncbi:MAG: hypothetical protein GKS00_21895 [Alphaproteobacteria bacterium]|nr:hypothetical protein [Alphaproteobacteria bacterium]